MGKRAVFPQFDILKKSEKQRLIDLAELDAIDVEIARGKLLHNMYYADIGAEVNMDRSSVGYRMRRIIIPKLESHMDQLSPIAHL